MAEATSANLFIEPPGRLTVVVPRLCHVAPWETEDPLDATAPLEELVAARPSPLPAAAASGPSRRAWFGIGVSGLLSAGAVRDGRWQPLN